MTREPELTLITGICGPQGKCGCQCPDGPCGHDFRGEAKEVAPNTFSIVCQKCGMSAFEHSMWVSP